MTRRTTLVGGTLLLCAGALLLLLRAGGSSRSSAAAAHREASDAVSSAATPPGASDAVGSAATPPGASDAVGFAAAPPGAPAASPRPVLPPRPTPQDLIAYCDPVDLRFLADVERLGGGVPAGALDLVRMGQRGASEAEMATFVAEEIGRPLLLRALATRWLRQRTAAPAPERRPLAGPLPHPEGLVQPLRRADPGAGTP